MKPRNMLLLVVASMTSLISCSPSPRVAGFCPLPLVTGCEVKSWLKAQDKPDYVEDWIFRLSAQQKTIRANCGYPEPDSCK